VPLLLLALVLLTPLLALLLMPVTIVQRYRAGTSRRRVRRWVIVLNVSVAALSSAMLVLFATPMSLWVPLALPGALAGLGGGVVLGLVGLATSRWEATPRDLHVTPNRWLVLAVTVAVAARLLYGFWRAWSAWTTGADDTWLRAAGVPGSLAAGGLVLGYQLAYWLGVGRRLARHARAGAVVTIDNDTGRVTWE
jgi:hypothetical protein